MFPHLIAGPIVRYADIRDGQPVDGGKINIPIRFQLPKG
jgi:hypothetical protein